MGIADALAELQPPPVNLAAYLDAHPEDAAAVLEARARGVSIPRIAAVIEDKTGIACHIDTLGKWIRRQHGG